MDGTSTGTSKPRCFFCCYIFSVSLTSVANTNQRNIWAEKEKQLFHPVFGKLKMLHSGKSLNRAKWFSIVLKIKGRFSVLIMAMIRPAATTTLFSIKSSCIRGKVSSCCKSSSGKEGRRWWRTALEAKDAFTGSLSTQNICANLWPRTRFHSTVDVHLTATGATHPHSDADPTVGLHSALSFRGPWSEGLLFSLPTLCFVPASIALTAGAVAFCETLWV